MPRRLGAIIPYNGHADYASQVFDPRMPSLSSFCAVENPFMPRSMMKAEMPRAPA